MQLINLKASNNIVAIRVLSGREYSVRVEAFEDHVNLHSHYEGDIEGILTLTDKEALSLAEAIGHFFKEGKRGEEFVRQDAVIPARMPKIQLSHTTWGDPFEEGMQFRVSDDFESYNPDEFGFSLYEYDARELKNLILERFSTS